MSSQPTSPTGTPPGAEPAPGAGGPAPTEQELREAYEAELSRITSAEMILQAAVSLLNIAGYRLSLTRGTQVTDTAASDPPIPTADTAADLDQVRDAIDAVRALLPVLERTRPAAELRPLRDALSQLQMAYAREAAATVPAAGAPAPAAPPGQAPAGQPPTSQPPTSQPPASQSPAGAPSPEPPSSEPHKGPAESSGRLWVPGR